MIDYKNYINIASKRLLKDGFDIKQDRILDMDVTIATKKIFKLTWFATQLNIFVCMSNVDYISSDLIKNFSSAALDYGIIFKEGLPRGLQSGVVSFSVLASLSIDEDAIKWINKKPKKHFAAFEFPVLYDLNNHEIYYYEKTPMWGAIYYGFFREFTLKNFKP